MKTNQFPTYCVTCESDVPAHHGKVMKLAGRWVCNCAPALPEKGYGDDDGYDAMKDAMAVNGTLQYRRRRY